MPAARWTSCMACAARAARPWIAAGLMAACLACGRRPLPPASDSIFDGTMADLSWPEVRQAASEGAIVLLPVGVIEEHGPHLKLGTDIRLAHLFCIMARRDLERFNIQAVIAPPYFWGMNDSTGAFPGSFSCRPETFKAGLHDVFASLKQFGFTRIFIFNWHGDPVHGGILKEAIEDGGRDLNVDIKLIEPPRWPTLDAAYKGIDIHAGARETSYMAAYFPMQVDATLARSLEPQGGDPRGWAGHRALETTPLGYFGNPAGFNAASGNRAAEAGAAAIADWVRAHLDRKTS